MSRARRLALALVAVLVVAGAAFDLYARVPAALEVAPLALDPATTSAVLLFHGRGGRDEPSLVALAERLRGLAAGMTGTAVVRYTWSPYSDTRFRSTVNGAAVGRALGAELARLPALRSVHLVGHSAGAYVLDPLCEAFRAAGGTARVAITYLDPIGFHGVFDYGWGARNYGACADYAEAFINTDDPVPATNAPLSRAWNVDVTAAGAAATYPGGGHRWPVQYYLAHAAMADVTAADYSNDERPRGAVTVAR